VLCDVDELSAKVSFEIFSEASRYKVFRKMIDDHQKVLDKLQDAAKNTTNTDLRASLEKATGKVQQHLTKAQDIKANVLKD